MTLEEMEKSMTLFYMKRTGDIVNKATGIQDMKFYSDFEEDYNKIIDFVVLAKDEYVLNNIEKFKIVDKKLILKEKFRTNIEKYINQKEG